MGLGVQKGHPKLGLDACSCASSSEHPNQPFLPSPLSLKLLLKLQSFTDWEEDRKPESVPDHEANGKQ